MTIADGFGDSIDIRSLFEVLYGQLQQTMPRETFDTWLRRAELAHFQPTQGDQPAELTIRQQNESALSIARFLQGHPFISRVFYPGLETHKYHDVAARQMRGFGGVLSFQLQGDFDSVRAFLPRLKFAHAAANLGAVETVVGPPATTSHVECTREKRAAMGIPETLIRYSVGIEDTADLIADLQQALDSTAGG